MSETIMLTTIEVASGIYRVKFFLWMYTSPGSLPTKGILLAKSSKIPTATINMPSMINDFASAVSSIAYFFLCAASERSICE
jgi:hypothetical protein